MSLSASTVWECRSTGSDLSSGGFNVGSSNFPTDLAATSATGASPVVTSASYTFVAGDVGYWLFIKSGTNWTPGWYQIASVNAGAATLSAAIGAADLYGGATLTNTAAGCATTASPTGGTWGMDYSIYQDTARFSFTDMVIDGTTNTKFTSAAFPVGKNMVGNLINVASGTGFTVQFVEVVSTSGTTATCDKSLGTLSSTGGTGKMGGGLATQAKAIGVRVDGNKIFNSGSFTTTASITISAGPNPPAASAPRNMLIGYGTRRGDGVKANVTLSTNTGLTAINVTGTGWVIDGFNVDCASLGTSIGISAGTYGLVRNCKVSNFTSKGIALTSNRSSVYRCEVTGGTAAATVGIIESSGSGNIIAECYVHDNACTGITVGGQSGGVRNLVTNNTGASSDGIQSAAETYVLNNTVYGSGRHGISLASTNGFEGFYCWGNLIASNGGYGLVPNQSAGQSADSAYDGNAYWNNTSGTRSNADDVGAVCPVNGVAPYVNSRDVILTADPFVAKASNDFRLNTTAGGGAACRGHGVPTTWPGNSLTVAYPDMGAAQHIDPTGGGVRRSDMTGGFGG